MKIEFPKLILLVLAAAMLSGCLVQRTVTTNGQTVSSGYAVKRPLKEAMENSQQ